MGFYIHSVIMLFVIITYINVPALRFSSLTHSREVMLT